MLKKKARNSAGRRMCEQRRLPTTVLTASGSKGLPSWNLSSPRLRAYQLPCRSGPTKTQSNGKCN